MTGNGRTDSGSKGPAAAADPGKQRMRADYLRRTRKWKTSWGYFLAFLLVGASATLMGFGIKAGSLLLFIAVAWGFAWWHISMLLFPRFVGDTAVCPGCGGRVDLVDTWKCPGCGQTDRRHLLSPCRNCRSMSGKTTCPSCGTDIYV
jgi:predicted RNA-binding Zn-ribbon protein involved in translation (DUF1610 family)